MKTGIYKIENKKTHKIYIGQAYDINRRIRVHKIKTNSTQEIDKAIQEEGEDNFIFEIIEECSIEELNNKEKYWITYYNSFEQGYNNTRGGAGRSDSMVKLSLDEIKEIYDLLINSNLTQHQIALLYQVGDDTISEINHGTTRTQPGFVFPLRKNSKDTEKISKFKPFSLSKEQLIADFVELKSFTAIGKKYNVSAHPVRDIAKKYGYTAKTLKEEFLVKSKPKQEKRAIVQMDKEGNILQEFESTFAAGQQIHDEHIKQVCDGKRKSSKGFIYRYKDEL